MLRWSGEKLWARQLRMLRELSPDAVWISARTKPAWCPPDVRVVLDKEPSRGPVERFGGRAGTKFEHATCWPWRLICPAQ